MFFRAGRSNLKTDLGPMNSAMDKEIRNLEEGQPAEYSGSSLAYLAALWSSGMQRAWWAVMGSLSVIVFLSLLSHGKRIAAESVQLRNILADFISSPLQSELIWVPDTCVPMAIPVGSHKFPSAPHFYSTFLRLSLKFHPQCTTS